MFIQSPMETMRQFLAAFAGSDRDGLYRLLTNDARLVISKKNMWFQSRDLRQTVDFLLAETNHWTRNRIDVQSWTEDADQLKVKFHVRVKRNGRFEEYAYTVSLSLRDSKIEAVELCGQSISSARHVWQFPKRPTFRLTPN